MQDVSRGEGRTVLFVSHNMAAVRRLCLRGVLLEDGMVKFMGSVGDTIDKYLNDEVIQDSFEGIDGDPKDLFLRSANVRSSDGGAFYNSSSIKIEFEVSVRKTIPSLVIGFNIYSQFQYPIARADYNDIDNSPSLPPGDYRFVFEIPPYTLSNGSYTIRFDVAERAVKCYTTNKSVLSFSIVQGEDCFGNAFSENIPIKSSLFREKWMMKRERI